MDPVLHGIQAASISKEKSAEVRWTVHVNGEMLPASGVVICTPALVAGDWLKNSVPEAASSLRQVDYLGVVCEVLLLKRSLTPYYVLNLTDRRLPFTGIIEFTNLTGREEFCGHNVVYLPRYASQTAEEWSKDDAQLHLDNMSGLKFVVPDLVETDIVAWHVNRARYVQPIHSVAGGKSVPGLVIAPKLAYLSSAQMHPWPVFNDGLVRHVDSHIEELYRAFNPPGTH